MTLVSGRGKAGGMPAQPDSTWVLPQADRFALRYEADQGHVEQVPLQRIAAEVGTPTYVYSADAIAKQYGRLADAVRRKPTLICYAVKANSSLAIIARLARLGAGADIVSGGELERALRAGVAPDKIVFSGVGKTDAELDRAIEVGIKSINVESAFELERVSARARALGAVAPVSLRVNPDVDPATHPYLATGLRASKFGIAMKDALGLALAARDDAALSLHGVGCHIGSMIARPEPFLDSVARLLELVETLSGKGVRLRHLDLGGGLGIAYKAEDQPFDLDRWGRAVMEATADLDLELVLEPGRFLVGNAGVLLTRVLGRKQNHDRSFVIVDAAMNDLLRPSLYSAYHAIVPVHLPTAGDPTEVVDIVGPVCESGDFLARDRPLAGGQQGDLLAVLSAGAYGMTMASTYNTRPLPAEVLVEGDRYTVIRPRKSIADLLADEVIPASLGD